MSASASSIGLSTFTLASPFSDADLGRFGKVKAFGYDQVEVCIEATELLTAAAVGAAARREGLGVLVCAILAPERDLAHEELGRRERGVEFLRRCVDFAADAGSPLVSGPFYAAAGRATLLGPASRPERLSRARDGLARVAEHAAQAGVRLALEPLNRFESDLVNTVGDGLSLCDAVGASNVGVLLDTFHMNIEEKSLSAAARTAGARIFHVQVSENDCGAPGSGHIDWPAFLEALREVRYAGSFVVESFSPQFSRLADAACIWRPVAASMEALARDAVAYLRPLLSAH